MVDILSGANDWTVRCLNSGKFLFYCEIPGLFALIMVFNLKIALITYEHILIKDPKLILQYKKVTDCDVS